MNPRMHLRRRLGTFETLKRINLKYQLRIVRISASNVSPDAYIGRTNPTIETIKDHQTILCSPSEKDSAGQQLSRFEWLDVSEDELFS